MVAVLQVILAVAAATAAPDAHIALDVDDPRLADLVAERLREEGFVVVPVGTDASIHLAGRTTADTFELVASADAVTRTRVVRISGVERWAIELEIAQKAVSLVRETLDGAAPGDAPKAPPPPPPSPPVAVPPPVPPPVAEQPPQAEGEAPLVLGVAGGAAWRASAVDPTLQIDGWYDLDEDWSAGARVIFLRPISGEVSVVEWQAQGGVRRVLGRPVRGLVLELGVVAGVEVHHFSRAPIFGVRFAALVGAPLRIALSIAPLEIGLCLTPGLANAAREHIADGERIWFRGAFRAEGALQIAWRL